MQTSLKPEPAVNQHRKKKKDEKAKKKKKTLYYKILKDDVHDNEKTTKVSF